MEVDRRLPVSDAIEGLFDWGFRSIQHAGTERVQLPAGFPPKLSGSMAWRGADFKKSDFIFHLSDADIAELESALVSFKCE